MALTGAAAARPDGDAHAIRSYARRGTRLTPGQLEAWDTHSPRFVVPTDIQTADGFAFGQVFSREAPLVVEVGFGVGEALLPLAQARPECNVLGFEVWRPGVADCLASLAAEAVTNVRLSTLDAAWAFEHLIEPASITELWTFFPDPWPKSRHHKRRLIDHRFAALAASRLVPGGQWRLATDWAHYADQMQAVLDAEPTLSGEITTRYDERPLTKFERRGLAAGRDVTDLTYARVD